MGRRRRIPAWAGMVLCLAAGYLLYRSVWPGFSGQRPVDPIALALGPLTIRWYGLLIAASLIPAWFLAEPYLKERGVSPDTLATVALVAIPAGLAGARLGYVVQNLDFFLRDPLRIPAVWEGGLSIHGALLGGTLALAGVARRLEIPFLLLADGVMPSVLLSQAVGRWGNYFNQELFGYPTDLPWKMFVEPAFRPPEFATASYFHPTFLYESLWNLAGAGLLFAVRRRGRRTGEILFLYLIVYSAGRFWVEFFRIGHPWLLGLTLAQWVSLALIVGGAIGLLARLPSGKSARGDFNRAGGG